MKLYKSIITHRYCGRIIVTHNPRARRIIMRARPDAIYMTVPLLTTENDIERALEKYGAELLRRQKENKRTSIDKNYRIDTPNFKFEIKESDSVGTKITGNNGKYILYCPIGTDYANESTSQRVRQSIMSAMRHCAGVILPARLEALAKKHGFKYSRCSVRDVHSLWGSCTSKGNISLNIRLIMLPDKLIDYVLLHELCHTVEMNHSERFWALMDRCTAPTRSKALRAELKQERITVLQ